MTAFMPLVTRGSQYMIDLGLVNIFLLLVPLLFIFTEGGAGMTCELMGGQTPRETGFAPIMPAGPTPVIIEADRQ